MSMYLKHRESGHMVEVLGVDDLFNPMHESLFGRYHYGEEAQDPERFAKASLIFLSGEELPQCWRDVHYRDRGARQAAAA
jgi:hypothetical protein